MAANMIVVTFFIPGGFIPREFKAQFRGDTPDEILAQYAPREAFAFRRSDRIGMNYIDGEVFPVEELESMDKPVLVRNIISDGVRSAVRLRGHDDRWASFHRIIDRVVKTSR
ncbi:MAG: hypothetical protein ACFNYO_03515 [Candidatus Saccharimonas sp.]|jgi:hypothetical protein